MVLRPGRCAGLRRCAWPLVRPVACSRKISPIPRSTFRYRFDIVMDCHPQDDALREALIEIREWTREVRIFGSYPATSEFP